MPSSGSLVVAEMVVGVGGVVVVVSARERVVGLVGRRKVRACSGGRVERVDDWRKDGKMVSFGSKQSQRGSIDV